MRVFKTQLILIAVLWGVAGLCILLDITGPMLTTPPTANASTNSTTITIAKAGQLGSSITSSANGSVGNNNNNIVPGRAQPPGQNQAVPAKALAPSQIQSPATNNGNTSGAAGRAQAPSTSITTDNNAKTGGGGLFGIGGSNNANGGGGIFYNYARNLPAQAGRLFFLFQIGWIALAILFSYFFTRRVMVLREKQLRANIHVALNSQTVLTNPPSADGTTGETAWFVTTTTILGALYNYMVALPGNQSRARMQGAGGSTPMALDLVCLKGDGIRHAVRLPLLTSTTADIGQASADSGGSGSGQTDEKASLVKEFTNLLTSQYRWCEVEALPVGQDLLDLDSYTHPAYVQTKGALSRGGPGKSQLVRGWQLLTLARDSHFPIKTNWSAASNGGGNNSPDPISLIYKAIDCQDDNELTACGIREVLAPPANDWRIEGNLAQEKWAAIEMKHQASSRYVKPKNDGGGLMGGIMGNGSGGKKGSQAGPKLSPAAAAKNRRAMQQYETAREAIEGKLAVNEAFPVYIFVWAEGTEVAVRRRLTQLSGAFINQFNSISFTTKDGATDGNTFKVSHTSITPVRSAATNTTNTASNANDGNNNQSKGSNKQKGKGRQHTNTNNESRAEDGLAAVREWHIPAYFAPERSVLTVKELAALWHFPSPTKVQNDRLIRAGAMSPAPEKDLIHRTIAPDGTITTTDNKWRRVVGQYPMPDGSVAEVGLTEQGILRGTYIPSKPGGGKSTDILSFALQGLDRNDGQNVGKGDSSRANNSVIMADPNGDLTRDFMNRIASEYEDLVIVVDQSDPEWLVGLNLMARPPRRKQRSDEFVQAESLESAGAMLASLPVPEEARIHLEDELKAFVKANDAAGKGNVFKVSDGEVGRVAASVLDIFIRNLNVNVDRTPNIFRIVSNGVRLAVEADPHATLLTIVKLFQDPAYREALLAESNERFSAAYYASGGEFDKLLEKGGVAPAMGRLEMLLRQEVIWRVFCQRHQTLNIRQAADEGKVILFYFDPNLQGDKDFSMAVIFTLITQAIFSRTDIKNKEERRTVEVYLDEFQEIVASDKGSLEQWLSQARKFGGAIVLAHQFLDQIGKVLPVILGTIGSYMPMILSRKDAKGFAQEFQNGQWPLSQIQRTFAKLPAFSKVAKLYDNGRDHDAVLLRNLPFPLALSNADATPLLVAVNDNTRLRGYRLETYATKPEYSQALQLSTKKGEEGQWEPSAYGLAHGIRPATRDHCLGLIEEMTAYLYGAGMFSWKLVSPDPEEAAQMGLTSQIMAEINADLHKLRHYYELLIQIEALPYKARIAKLIKLSQLEWQLYLASRYGRGLALDELIGLNPGLIPNREPRMRTRSNLKYATPITEIEAESQRPDPFIVLAEQRRKEARLQERKENADFYDEEEWTGGAVEVEATEEITVASSSSIEGDRKLRNSETPKNKGRGSSKGKPKKGESKNKGGDGGATSETEANFYADNEDDSDDY